MGNNFTPLDRATLEKKFAPVKKKLLSFDTVLLLIGTLTAIILAFMLFVLIQKRMQSQQTTVTPTPGIPTLAPTAVPTPTLAPVVVSPTATPSATVVTPTATPSGTLTPTPTKSTPTATPSPTKAPSPSPLP